jgi:hypothetical protein
MIMNTFAQAVIDQEARTANNMKALKSSASPLTDLFFKIGASRGKNVIPDFVAAYVADKEVALRITQWARDVREGAGERQLFRDILSHLEKQEPEAAKALMDKIPEIGRFDDLLIDHATPELEAYAFDIIKAALDKGNGLAAKWTPRKGAVAAKLRNHFGWTPKYYRKRLVELTKVVETQMCSNQWDEINFSHVPSLASSRYKKAFHKHTPKFAEYVAALKSGDPTVKVNAGAVYPYDVLKGLTGTYRRSMSGTELDHIVAQWNALPNYVGDANVLPMVDVSGSMACPAGGYNSKSGVTCLDVSVSLGLYCADKNKGKFKDTFLTFSGSPELVNLRGNIVDKIQQMNDASWAMNTDLHAAFAKVLEVARKGNVSQEEMPDVILILSDMQFDQCASYDDSAMEMIERKYVEAGYKVPSIVFWNLNAYDNVPVKFDRRGVALVSGFSPTILKSVLSSNFDDMTPEGIMRKTVMVDRYNIKLAA